MPAGSQYELYGNPGQLQSLSDLQASYRTRFAGILEQLATVASNAKGNWVGAGSEQYDASHMKHTKEYQDVQAAFGKLIGMTSDASGRWAQTCSFANSRF